MARYTGPKHRLSRRVGYCLWGSAKSPANRRPYPPGQHGNKATGRKKESNYSKHLLEKQKLRHTYGMLERQFRNTFTKAASKRGSSGEAFLSMLETRLDAFVFRSGFTPTIWAARQLVTHGHFLVNGQKVDIPSAQVKPGDVVSLREKSRTIPMVLKALEMHTAAPPPYLEVLPASFESRLKEKPQARDIPVKIDLALVVEFYSR